MVPRLNKHSKNKKDTTDRSVDEFFFVQFCEKRPKVFFETLFYKNLLEFWDILQMELGFRYFW